MSLHWSNFWKPAYSNVHFGISRQCITTLTPNEWLLLATPTPNPKFVYVNLTFMLAMLINNLQHAIRMGQPMWWRHMAEVQSVTSLAARQPIKTTDNLLLFLYTVLLQQIVVLLTFHEQHKQQQHLLIIYLVLHHLLCHNKYRPLASSLSAIHLLMVSYFKGFIRGFSPTIFHTVQSGVIKDRFILLLASE